MSLHRSLKTKSGALNQHRNVLTRAERIAKLSEQERFDASKRSSSDSFAMRSARVSTLRCWLRAPDVVLRLR